ncbi:MAG: thiamine monophosphate kinase [Candidatus Methanofastidiosum methylothiophilum]|uniref:Thiamine monophosphate kinase n=1 Tax=Candidatus Methanofastidiosum methylothiophilum TaxID=1705564 RepID=A0A150IX74_9EURY|nr:MAG: thiamine monophosphate kinase [Candidatus Methanofastidiosum methylthiophilus]KYC47144.1 MAG: thiamine monophosphate kinase [Candidatus Methanofastidiosum methylthiophilus]KYC49560.1 MAG: thiamine monophosphate kinase [Candidatus Methanofastidiosum methylthiophilus]
MLKSMTDLNRIVQEIRNYEGVKRKNPIKHLINQFKPFSNYGNTVIDFGDDAAVLKGDCNYLLFAADGIWANLLKDLFWAGYCAVLVNVNDIYAMGGKPVAMVNIMSLKKSDNCKDLLEGIKTGCDKFKVPMVGGHLHPDTDSTTVSVSIMGNATKILSSFSAKEGEDIILAMDMDGRQYNDYLNWDTTLKKSSEECISKLRIMNEIAEKELSFAAKDISNPGILGTIGMLLETSRKGAIINIDEIQRPDSIEFIDWLKIYPGYGFTLTSKQENTDKILNLFRKQKIEARVIGKVTNDNLMTLVDKNQKKTLFDFKSDIITGIK